MAYDLQEYNAIFQFSCCRLRAILYLTNFPLCVVVALQLTESCVIFILPEISLKLPLFCKMKFKALDVCCRLSRCLNVWRFEYFSILKL